MSTNGVHIIIIAITPNLKQPKSMSIIEEVKWDIIGQVTYTIVRIYEPKLQTKPGKKFIFLCETSKLRKKNKTTIYMKLSTHAYIHICKGQGTVIHNF
jgi:hypothetical protein